MADGNQRVKQWIIQEIQLAEERETRSWVVGADWGQTDGKRQTLANKLYRISTEYIHEDIINLQNSPRNCGCNSRYSQQTEVTK